MWPPSPPPGPAAQSEPQFTPAELVRLAPRLLAPPFEQWQEGMVADLPAVRGTYGSRRAVLRATQVGKARAGAASAALSVEIEGPTYGAVCSISAPAMMRNEPLTGDPAFDAGYEISAVPRAIGPLVCGPDVRARITAARPGFVRLEQDRVTFLTSSRPQSLEGVAHQLAAGATMLDRLPEALRAAGAAPAAGPGGFAGGAVAHPEIAQHQQSRTLVRTLLVVGLVLLIGGPLLVVAVIAALLR